MERDPPATLLRVDLGDERVTNEPVPREWRERYVGGKGLGARYLYDELPAGTDPRSPENRLLFMLGPLAGVAPHEQRYAAITKSPLTGLFLDSYSGGEFPAALAASLPGHLGIILQGQADRPLTLHLQDDAAELRQADSLWGQDAVATCDAFEDVAVACIGPAGESGVAYATIASDYANHHAGRGGAGTVMGDKRLKAVVAHDEPEPTDDLRNLREKYESAYNESDAGRWLAASDLVETVDFLDDIGALATRGWTSGTFEGVDSVGVEAVTQHAIGRERDDAGGFRVETPNGETVPRGAPAMSLGANLDIGEFDAVAILGETCDRLGLDLISAGNAVAWAMQASEAGELERTIAFGDAEIARTLLQEIATRSTDLGDALATGADGAGRELDIDVSIPSVKEMTAPGYDPRAAKSMALSYATSDRGACHRRARPIEREAIDGNQWNDTDRVRAVITEQNTRSVTWSLIVDDFVGDALHDDLGAPLLNAIGYRYTRASLLRVGERIWTLVRLFNLREGATRVDDRLPARFTEPLADGPAAGSSIDRERFESLLTDYYHARGWTTDGRPTRHLLDRLDLSQLESDSPETLESAD